MKFRKSFWLMAVTVLAMILSSCNIGATPAPTQDLGAIQTQAFNLVLTQVALQSSPTPLPTNTLQLTSTLSAPPTFAPVGGGTVTPFAFNTQTSLLTPIPTATPISAAIATTTTKNGCNDGIYLDEGPYYSDANHYLEVSIGQTIEQFFLYKNTGTCTWDEGYSFAFQPEISSPEITGNIVKLAKNKPEDYTLPGNQIRYKAIVKAPKTKGDYKAFWKLVDDGGNKFGSLVSLYIRVR